MPLQQESIKIGGQWEHTAGHCKNGIMVCSHEWVEGVIDYYHLQVMREVLRQL